MRLIDADALITEWCDGCKYLENGICDQDVCGGVLLMKDAPTIEAEPVKWIPVTERLPEMKADVLMYFAPDKNMAAGFMCDVDEDKTMWCAYTDGGFYTDCDFEPTHWMPLPKSPEDGGAENG